MCLTEDGYFQSRNKIDLLNLKFCESLSITLKQSHILIENKISFKVVTYIFVQAVDVGAVLDQQPDYGGVAQVAGPVEGPPLLLVAHIAVGTVLQQQLHHLNEFRM